MPHISHRLRLPGRATIAAVMAVATLIAATALAPDPAAAQQTGPDPSPQWSYCTGEPYFCSFTGTKQVRYGEYDIAGEDWMLGRWTSRTVTNGTACTNAVFGDPWYGRTKRCEVDNSPWKFCANEGGTCRATGWVRYGAPSASDKKMDFWGYSTRVVSGSIACTNAGFFGDPRPYAAKACWVYTG